MEWSRIVAAILLTWLAWTQPAHAQNTLKELSGEGCSTQGTQRLAKQLLSLHRSLYPDDLIPLEQFLTNEDAIRRTHDRVNLYFQPDAARAFARAAQAHYGLTREPVQINSAYRTVAEQYVLLKGCTVAALPGRSDHQGGLALDIQNYTDTRIAMTAENFEDGVPNDPVHFDYEGGGTTDAVKRHTVEVFQLLWSLANPQDPIAIDGLYGPETEARLGEAPLAGFAPVGGGTCVPTCYDGYGIRADCHISACNEGACAFQNDRIVCTVGDPCDAQRCKGNECELAQEESVCIRDESVNYTCSSGMTTESETCPEGCRVCGTEPTKPVDTMTGPGGCDAPCPPVKPPLSGGTCRAIPEKRLPRALLWAAIGIFVVRRVRRRQSLD